MSVNARKKAIMMITSIACAKRHTPSIIAGQTAMTRAATEGKNLLQVKERAGVSVTTMTMKIMLP